MPKILITGSNSFIGNNFRKLSKYTEIDEISLFEISPAKIEFGKYNVVIHLAAIVHQSKRIPIREYFKINRDLCLQVARYAKEGGVQQFIFLSTVKVYGTSLFGGVIRDEYSECLPDDTYGQSKYEAEVGLRKLEDEDFVVSIIRPSLVYGYGVKANMLKLVKLIDHFLVLPFARINNKRNFTYIKNLVGYIDQIIETRASGIFIAIDDKAISTTELVKYISFFLGRKIIVFKLPNYFIRIGTYLFPSVFEGLYGSLQFDNRKTLLSLNYMPPYTTEEGIKDMITFYKESKRA